MGTLLLLVVFTLTGFYTAAALREAQSWHQAAPSTGRQVVTSTGVVFIQEVGPADGAPVLFIHGTGAWSEIWRPSLNALGTAGFHAIALDLPPFGFSEKSPDADYRPQEQAKIILALLDALKIRRISLVGHSFGSRATIEVALDDPQRIVSLVLVDAALGLDVPSAAAWWVRTLFSITPLRHALVATTATNPLLTQRLLQLLIKNPEDARADTVAMLQRPMVIEHSTEIFSRWLNLFIEPQARAPSDEPASYTALTMPTLLLWGAEDSLTPVNQGERLAKLLPDSRLVTLKGIGHIPHIEDVEAFNHALLPFLLQYH